MDADGPAGDVDARAGLFDRTINAYGEARAAIRAALQMGGGEPPSDGHFVLGAHARFPRIIEARATIHTALPIGCHGLLLPRWSEC